MAHRLIIAAAISGGGTVQNVAYSKDIDATLGCLEALGVKTTRGSDFVTVDSGLAPKDGAVLDCVESGSTLRFLIPVVLACGVRATFTGRGRLFERPLNVYEELAKKQGFSLIRKANSLTVSGSLCSNDITVRGDISSQFITGLIFGLAVKNEGGSIKLSTRLESKPYVDMTVCTLRSFGANIEASSDGYRLLPSELSARNVKVEGDWSNAAFLDAFGLSGKVSVEGLDDDSLQGDRIYRNYFTRLVNGKPTLDISDCPDLGPVLMAVAALYNGATFTGTRRLKIKESDRGVAMQKELSKCGVKVEVNEDSISVHGGELQRPTVTVSSHNDHRIAMSMAVILSCIGGEIEGAEAVEKSYPDFWEIISSLGIEVEIHNEA